ncbi:uncharacterized protein EV420DRAFT_269086 [Desarmillaria tabescens]|uniref:Amino acid permease/ SLC12A domain-containing protein n=1 Tax=Armillaria tabescens TaxID=1929756 RepID=A0AA39N6S4_ARMTA|nr:uncharacterized protein EV420DRAFT_269086 [Desarmillaria tabescens]KAK0459484.1 hypothetical protein EV420DRAFT_269086 [Desarmillaria tabescens]
MTMVSLLMASLVAGSIGVAEACLILLDGLAPVITLYTMVWRYLRYGWWSKEEIDEVSKVRSMVTFSVLFVITLSSSILTTVLEVQGQLIQSFAALPNPKPLAIALAVLSWLSPLAGIVGFAVTYREKILPPPVLEPPRVVRRLYSNDTVNLSRTHSMELGHITTEYKIGSFTPWDPSRTHRTVIPRVQLEPSCRIPDSERWSTVALD